MVLARTGRASHDAGLCDGTRACKLPGPSMSRIVVRGLTKRYRVAARRAGMVGALRGVVSRSHRVVEALAGIDFTIEPGEMVGYIGPNGAGKSTTVKLLAGILVPDAGSVE